MNLKKWWSNLPERYRIALQMAWCAALVLVLVIFWSQQNDFVYAAF